MASSSSNHLQVHASGLHISGLQMSGLQDSLFDADLRLSEQSDGVLDGLIDSKGSAVDFLFDSLEKSIASMSLDSRFEPLPVRGGRMRRRKSLKQFQIDAVNFDPPAQRQPSRRASLDDDMSVLSLPSLATPAPSRDENLVERQASEPKIRFQKLAESMQRSEVTRRQVMMQRQMLSPEQQRALYEAREWLIKEAQHQPRSVHPTQLSPEKQRILQEAEEKRGQEAQHQPIQVRPSQLSTEQQRGPHKVKERLCQEAHHQSKQVRPTQLTTEQQQVLQEAKDRLGQQETQHEPRQVWPKQLSFEHQRALLPKAEEWLGHEAQHQPRQVRITQQRQDGQLQQQVERLQQQNQYLFCRMASFFATAA